MAGRTVRWLTWAVVVLALLGFGLYLALGLSGPRVSGPAAFSPDDAVWVLGQAAYAIVGAIVASRRPKLSIGWLFCVAGLLGLVERVSPHALLCMRSSTPQGRPTAVRPPGCRRLSGIPTLDDPPKTVSSEHRHRAVPRDDLQDHRPGRRRGVVWQRRPLEALYPVIYLDALVVKVKDGAHARNKAAHIAVGVDVECGGGLRRLRLGPARVLRPAVGVQPPGAWLYESTFGGDDQIVRIGM
jgi:hypothetical protein